MKIEEILFIIYSIITFIPVGISTNIITKKLSLIRFVTAIIDAIILTVIASLTQDIFELTLYGLYGYGLKLLHQKMKINEYKMPELLLTIIVLTMIGNLAVLMTDLIGISSVILKMIVSSSVVILFTFGYIYIYKKVDEYVIIKTDYFISIRNRIICSFFTVLTIIQVYMNISGNILKYQKELIFVIFIGVFLIIYFLFIEYNYVRNKMILVMQEKQNKDFERYISVISEQNKQIEHFKHDYKNILITLSSYIKDTDNDELKSYYSKIVEYSEEKLEELSIQGSMTINNLKSEALKNVIIAKQHKAKSMNIEFICDIPKEIIDLQIDEIDLIRIVSILIDNAFEGASLARKKKVSFLIDSYGSEGYDIIIKNTIQESENSETSVNSWLIDGISSKSNKRGHGLAIVRELIKNNQQVGLTVIKEKNFVEVTLEVGEF